LHYDLVSKIPSILLLSLLPDDKKSFWSDLRDKNATEILKTYGTLDQSSKQKINA
jgi:hypothetical protein